jgi:hypothetical protein
MRDRANHLHQRCYRRASPLMERKRFKPFPPPGKNYGVHQKLTEDPEGILVSSEVTPNIHLPVIDMDYSIEAKESITPGHHHLYINKPVTWKNYKRLLKALLKADLIEQYWYESALKAKKSLVFHPSYLQKKVLDVLSRKGRR